MGCFAPDAPAPIDYGKATLQTLQAQANMAPTQYSLESAYQPAYGALTASALQQLLQGTTGGEVPYSYSYTALKKGWYDDKGNLVSTKGKNWDGAPAGATYRDKNTQWTVDQTVKVPQSDGLLSLMNQQNQYQRQADIADVEKMGARATNAMLEANPFQKDLLSRLNTQAVQGLDAGSGLTADEARAMQQASRAGSAARGMSGSNAGLADELMRQFGLGQQLLRQRQAFAQSVLQNNQAVLGDPFQQILGRQSGAVAMAQNALNNSGPQIFNPNAGLGLAQSNYDTQSQFAAASPSTLGQIGMIAGTVGGVAGGLGSAMGALSKI